MYQTWSDVYRNHNMIRVLTRSRKGTENPRVGGSIPSLGTRSSADLRESLEPLGSDEAPPEPPSDDCGG